MSHTVSNMHNRLLPNHPGQLYGSYLSHVHMKYISFHVSVQWSFYPLEPLMEGWKRLHAMWLIVSGFQRADRSDISAVS